MLTILFFLLRSRPVSDYESGLVKHFQCFLGGVNISRLVMFRQDGRSYSNSCRLGHVMNILF